MNYDRIDDIGIWVHPEHGRYKFVAVCTDYGFWTTGYPSPLKNDGKLNISIIIIPGNTSPTRQPIEISLHRLVLQGWRKENI